MARVPWDLRATASSARLSRCKPTPVARRRVKENETIHDADEPTAQKVNYAPAYRTTATTAREVTFGGPWAPGPGAPRHTHHTAQHIVFMHCLVLRLILVSSVNEKIQRKKITNPTMNTRALCPRWPTAVGRGLAIQSSIAGRMDYSTERVFTIVQAIYKICMKSYNWRIALGLLVGGESLE